VTRWLQEGAQPTDRVRRILVGAGLMEAEPARPAPATKASRPASQAEKAK
jgi:ribosomal protein S16